MGTLDKAEGICNDAAMNGWRISAGDGLRWRDALLGLALFAAIVRSLIPAGFMPAVHDGQFSMVICTADGARTLDGEVRQPTGADGAMAASHAPCAFAGLASLAPPPVAPIVSLALAIETGAVAIDETPDALPPPDYRPQSPRAPPSLHA